MTRKLLPVIILLIVGALASCEVNGPRRGHVSAYSPGRNAKIEFSLTDKGEPQWALTYKGKPVIEPSKLGFDLARTSRASKFDDETDLKDGFRIAGTKVTKHDETWEPVWGETKTIRNHYTELEVTLVQDAPCPQTVHDPDQTPNPGIAGRRTMVVRFRVYDHGAGLRYEFPEQKDLEYFVIEEELTQFRLTGDHLAWWIPGDYDSEEYVTQKTRLSEVRDRMPEAKQTYWTNKTFSDTGLQTPLQLKTDDGLYINIHEAACTDYSTMSLELNDSTFTLSAWLTPDAEGFKGDLHAPCHTPWRTVLVSDDARDMLSDKLILNLNEPCALDDVSWIHPVKYVGVWWEMITNAKTWEYGPKHGATTDNVWKYIDFAAANSIDQVLVEGWNVGWHHWEDNSLDQVYSFTTPYPDFDIDFLSDYAKQKGVRLLMHNETASAVEDYERQLPAALEYMNRYGYDAVKTGY